jgi:flagellin
MSVINTNITSMIGQSNLNKSQNALQTSMERLSSGLRINSAKDDAAGQAIANRMSAQITGLAQAQRNANDGISVAQTAEGALNQVNDNLQRIRELSVQAQNSTNSQDDLESIQNEITQRLSEIDRISEQTSFNGVDVLASDRGLTIQVGANDGEAITVNLSKINSQTLGLLGFNVDGTGTPNEIASQTDLAANGFISNGDGTFTNTAFNTAGTIGDAISRVEGGDVVTFAAGDATGDAYTFDASKGAFTYDEAARADTGGADLAARLKPAGDEVNTFTIGGTANGELEINVDSNGAVTRASDGAALYFNQVTGDLTENNAAGSSLATIGDIATVIAAAGDGTAAPTAGALSITTSEGTTFTNTAAADNYDVTGDTITRTELQAAIEGQAAATQAFSVADSEANSRFAFDGTAAAGEQLRTAAAGDFVYISGFDNDTIVTAASATDAASQTITERDDGTFVSVLGGESQTVYVTENGDLSLEAIGNRTVTEDPLATLDAALNQVDSLRSELGAVQNRFEDAINNLSTNATNLSAARSRIEDADYAVEVANMTRAQILQQAGTSVLAQANQIPQNVLSLLG